VVSAYLSIFYFVEYTKKRFLIKAVDFLETENHDETEKKIVRGDISPHFQATAVK